MARWTKASAVGWIVAAAVGLAIAGPALPPAESRAKLLTAVMKERLELTEDQTAKVQQINLRAAKSVDAAIGDPGASRDAQMEGARAAQRQRDLDLKSVLTDTQWTKYQELKREIRAEAQSRIAGPPK